MKYERENSEDWVEIVGAEDVTMRQMNAMWEADQDAARVMVAGLVKDAHFVVKGEPVDMTVEDWVFDLTIKQWDWLRQQIPTAAREDEVSGEA